MGALSQVNALAHEPSRRPPKVVQAPVHGYHRFGVTFTCDSCQRRYSIADEKVRGRTVKIRCKNCQNVITVQGPPEESTKMLTISEVEQLRSKKAPPTAPKSPWENEATRATPALDLSVEWFAMIKGQQTGPHDLRVVMERVSAGEVTLRTYLWRKGMADWKRAADLPELAMLFASAPPAAPPPRAPSRTGAQPIVRAAVEPASRTPPKPPPRTGTFAAVMGPAPSAGAAVLAAPHADPPWVTGQRAPENDGPASTSEGLEALFNGHAAQADESTAPTERKNGDSFSVQAEGAQYFDSAPTDRRKQVEAPADPFAELGPIDPAKLPAPGESTSFFIAQAGVNKRNPPWKIALFALAVVGLPGAALFGLSNLKIQVIHVDETGHEVAQTQSVFSAGGVSGLKDLLLGHPKKPVPDKVVAEKVSNVHSASPIKPASSPSTSSVGVVAHADLPKGMSQADLKSFYGKQEKGDVGPRVRAGAQEQARDTGAALSQEQIGKVVSQMQPAFQNCIEQGLKRNPGFRGGKVILTATVVSSGVVKHVGMDKADLARTDIGECVRERARRMVFPAFAGEDVDVEIPLLMGVTM
jgi:predicted Zn finger-like uncharacterized protein